MRTQETVVRVTPDAARIYQTASVQDRHKFQSAVESPTHGDGATDTLTQATYPRGQRRGTSPRVDA